MPRLRAAAAPTNPPLGNLFADALRDAVPGADAAIGYSAGPGGLRAGLAAGPITQGAVYDAFPFDNRVVRAELSGRELHRLITAQLVRSRLRGRSLGVSGLRVEVDCRAGDFAVEVRAGVGGSRSGMPTAWWWRPPISWPRGSTRPVAATHDRPARARGRPRLAARRARTAAGDRLRRSRPAALDPHGASRRRR